MTLYEIDLAIQQFVDNMLDAVNEDGELVDIDPEKLEQLQAARKDKLEAIACYYKNLVSDAEAIKAEETNLKARRETMERKAERLKSLLSMSLLNSGDTEFSTAKCAVSFRESTQVVIPDEDLLDPSYMNKKIKFEPDKKLIRKAIESGTDVSGAFLEKKKNIQIK